MPDDSTPDAIGTWEWLVGDRTAAAARLAGAAERSPGGLQPAGGPCKDNIDDIYRFFDGPVLDRTMLFDEVSPGHGVRELADDVLRLAEELVGLSDKGGLYAQRWLPLLLSDRESMPAEAFSSTVRNAFDQLVVVPSERFREEMTRRRMLAEFFEGMARLEKKLLPDR
jgi:hypothetical protein